MEILYKKNHLHSIAAFFCLFIFLLPCVTGCKKFVTVDAPKTQLTANVVFTNDSTAIAAIRAVYGKMTSNSGFATGSSSSVTFLSAMSADELTNYSTISTTLEFYKNAILPNNPNLTKLWHEPYQCIYASNAIIEGLNSSSGVTQNIRNQITGEAKFIRAFCYFYLVNLFGDVPLVLTTDYRENTLATRTPTNDVYHQIILDLNDAQNLLANDYSYSGNERIRVNKWVATAFLARVYLFQKNWNQAEIAATSVISNSAAFSLLSDLTKVFLKNSNEAIWQLLPFVGNNTQDGNNFILTSAPSTTLANSCSTVSTGLLNAFEPNDKRRLNWINSITVGTQTYYFPFKYRVKTSTTQTEYSMILRLAEQYLIRAEARAQQNNLVGSIADLNVIRSRAGLPSLSTGLTQNQILDAIEQERRVELFTEWGHRWLDLKRTNRANTIMPQASIAKGSTWNTNWQLYPIPQDQILNDPNMANSQNPGY